MKDKCVEAVTAAAGRALTKAEIKGLEDRISRNYRKFAATDRKAFNQMTGDERWRQAAKLASEELVQEAEKKKQRTELAIQKHDAIDNYMREQKARYGMSDLESLRRVLAFVADGKSRFQSVETRAHALAADHIRQLVDTFETISPKFFGLFQNKDGIRALVYEMFGQDSKSIAKPEIAALAKKGAEAWSKTADATREQFNSAGGEIGYLRNWRMPQYHSQKLIATAGREEWLKTLSPAERAKAAFKDAPPNVARDKWIRDIVPLLDRRKYVKNDGSLMTDPELFDMLRDSWLTIASGGADLVEPGKRTGEGMLAEENAKHRNFHFKDADAFLQYHEKYGGRDPYTVMMGHITSLSHEIAMLETLGPNPDHAFQYWLETGAKDETLGAPEKAGKVRAQASSLQDLYNYIAGKSQPVANWKIAQGFDTLRNWLVATRLGSSYITSITDNATMYLGSAVNGMPAMQLMRNQLETLNPLNHDELRMARRAGLSLQTLIGEMNRWGTEALGPSFSSKMANLTVRISGLNAATEARRRAFGVTMYGSIGSAVRKAESLAGLEGTDRRLLESKGVTDADFKVWKAAELEDWGRGNDTMLTPEAVYRVPDEALAGLGDAKTLRREAALKLLGMVNEEVNMAVIEPGALEKTITKVGTQRGTWKGEITRSFFLFKSFPLALIMRHWSRGMNMQTAGGKALYMASLIASTTVLGAAAQQISQVVAGKDPQDMMSGKFLAAALMKGGSLGIYGDFLLSTNTSYGSTPLAVLSGPVAGYIEDIIGLTQGNLVKYAQGQKTTAGADAIKLLKSNIPLQNLWYTKAATDRLIFNQLQEMVSPGYNRRVEQRAQKEFHQSYYWRPGSVAPDRGPDFSKAVGQ